MNNFKTAEFTLDNKEIGVFISKDNNSIWLSQNQIALLFDKNQSTIARHIKNILDDLTVNNQNELMQKMHEFNEEGSRFVSREITGYHLDLVIKIGHRIKSNNAERLKELIEDYLSKPSINNEDIIIYDNGEVKIDVNVSIKEDTVWLSMEQTALLFETSKSAISYHVKRIIEDGELDVSTVKDSLTVQLEGDRKISRSIMFYNLDMIISIGYRVNSKKGIQFRRWASNVLKQYAINGYAINKDRLTLMEQNVAALINDVNGLKLDVKEIRDKAILKPIKEKFFFAGEYFDAYNYISSLIAPAKRSVIIIDPYFDASGLTILRKTNKEVIRKIYISSMSNLLDKDIELFRKEYGNIEVIKLDSIHDRFIIIDEEIFYLMGTSFNYAGNKLFVITQIIEEENKRLLIGKIQSKEKTPNK